MHWAPHPRRFPSPFPVVSCAFLERKDRWVRRAFKSCNFSLILRGWGEYCCEGRSWRVEAPCVVTQWPGRYVEYGPPVPEETWDEFYIIYSAKHLSQLKRCGFLDWDRPVWPIRDRAAVDLLLKEIRLLMRPVTPESVVDRMDRLCERLVLETLLNPFQNHEEEEAIHQVLVQANRDLRQSVDLREAASRAGMSLSTFRRKWMAHYKVPPGRFLQQLRIREACRLLVETRRPIQEIAREVGFEDELYFSRRFRKEMEMAPREYRKAYRNDSLT